MFVLIGVNCYRKIEMAVIPTFGMKIPETSEQNELNTGQPFFGIVWLYVESIIKSDHTEALRSVNTNKRLMGLGDQLVFHRCLSK